MRSSLRRSACWTVSAARAAVLASDGSVVVGEPIECATPVAAIVRAQGLWKVLGHTGAVAFSRTGDPATGDFHDATVLRKFGDVPDDLSAL
jgi:hypothetical protein